MDILGQPGLVKLCSVLRPCNIDRDHIHPSQPWCQHELQSLSHFPTVAMIGLGSTLVPAAPAGPRTLVSPPLERIAIPGGTVEAIQAHEPKKTK